MKTFALVNDRASILYIYIPFGKTLSLVPKSRSSVKVKVKYQGHSFRKNGGISVSQTQLVYYYFFVDKQTKRDRLTDRQYKNFSLPIYRGHKTS